MTVKVDFKKYPDLDIRTYVAEELFKSAVKCHAKWQNNLLRGEGATGSRGQPWKDMGEAINQLTVEPKSPEHLSYEVGGDVVQLAIAEFGRAPNSKMPPHEPIADWCRRKGITPHEGQSFDNMVFNIRRKIAIEGIQGFAPGRKSALEVRAELPTNLENRFKKEIDKAVKNSG